RLVAVHDHAAGPRPRAGSAPAGEGRVRARSCRQRHARPLRELRRAGRAAIDPARAARHRPRPTPGLRDRQIATASRSERGGRRACGQEKFPSTDLSPSMTTLQAPVPEQAPPQPAKVEFAPALAVSDTLVPCANCAEQVEPQSIPPGLLVTVPDPLPAFETD